MGRSCEKNGRWKTGKDGRSPVKGEKRMRGRPTMRWHDCIKTDLERVGEEWRTTATCKRNWILLVKNVLKEK